MKKDKAEQEKIKESKRRKRANQKNLWAKRKRLRKSQRKKIRGPFGRFREK